MKLSEMPYFERWLIAGAIIGVAVGLLITALYYLTYALSVLVEYALGVSPIGFTPGQYLQHLTRVLLVPVILMAAFPLSLLVAMWLRTPVVGSDRAVRAYHHNLRMGAEEVPAAMISSAITVGLGGSAGLEGPASHLGAAVSQLMARRLGLTAEDVRRSVAIGLGAGIGTIFKSPFAGALLSAELLYRRDLEPDVIYPSMVASAVSYSIFGAAVGYSPWLGFFIGPFIPLQLPLFVVLGLVAAGFAMLYTRLLYGVSARMPGVVRNPFVRATLGGLAVGLIAVLFPEVMGEGFRWLLLLRQGVVPTLLPLALALALLPFAKVVATSLTLGSGGKGGVFAPSIDIGAMAGLAFGEAVHYLAPAAAPSPVPFMIVGMLATFGAASSAPVSSMLMTVEMTGSLTLLPGEMLALAVAMIVFRGPTLVREQYYSRAESPVHAGEYRVPVLRKVRVSEVQLRQAYVRHDARVSEAVEAVSSAGLLSLPVVDSTGRVLGIVSLLELRSARPDEPAIRYLRPEPGHVWPTSSLEEAINMISRTNSRYVIVEDKGRFYGVLTLDDIVAAYERAVSQAQG